MKISQHYFVRYEKLINHYKSVISEGFVEKHHIIPRCLGGGDETENLIALPTRAHFIAHALYNKAYPDNKKLAHAFAMMIVNNPHQNRKIGSRLYELAKTARSNAMKGVPRPEWVKEKLRKPKSNKENYKYPKSEEQKMKMSLAQKGIPKPQEQVQKMIISRKKYFEEKHKEYVLKLEMYRNMFLESGMTRKQFSEHYNIKYSTLKTYLRGL